MRPRRRSHFAIAAVLALLAVAAPARAAPGTEIPFRTPHPGSQHILIEARLGDRGPFTLLLDTGYVAPFTVALSQDAAARAGARPAAGPPFISRAAIGGPVRFDRFSLSRLELGPVRLPNASVGVTGAVDLVARAFGIRLDGLVGHDFLASRVIMIDYACRRVDLRAAAPATPPTGDFTIGPVRPTIIATALVNGRGLYRLILDTGAGITILSPRVATEAGVETMQDISLAGAGGAETGARAGRAEIALGTAPGRRTRVAVSAFADRVAREVGAPVDGIAGTGLLANGRLVLDYPARRFWLQPPRSCTAQAAPAKRQRRVSPAWKGTRRLPAAGRLSGTAVSVRSSVTVPSFRGSP